VLVACVFVCTVDCWTIVVIQRDHSREVVLLLIQHGTEKSHPLIIHDDHELSMMMMMMLMLQPMMNTKQQPPNATNKVVPIF
jgi:hypothetical protein